MRFLPRRDVRLIVIFVLFCIYSHYTNVSLAFVWRDGRRVTAVGLLFVAVMCFAGRAWAPSNQLTCRSRRRDARRVGGECCVWFGLVWFGLVFRLSLVFFFFAAFDSLLVIPSLLRFFVFFSSLLLSRMFYVVMFLCTIFFFRFSHGVCFFLIL